MARDTNADWCLFGDKVMSFKPTNVEKMILHMLADIGERLDRKHGETDYKLIREALYSGNYWALEWQFPGIFPETMSEEIVKETVDILDMWSFIEFAGGEKFPGFDGNRESEHLSVARMLTEHMERFESLRGRVGNGIVQLEAYLRMLEVFEPMRKNLGERNLSAEELEELKTAKIHPENR